MDPEYVHAFDLILDEIKELKKQIKQLERNQHTLLENQRSAADGITKLLQDRKTL